MAEVKGDMAVKDNLAVEGNAKFNKGVDLSYVEIIDQKTSGTSGGAFNSGAWRVRDLSFTVVNDFATSITLPGAGNGGDFTLPKGTYYCEISCPAFDVGPHMTRLADATDNSGDSATTVITGTAEECDANTGGAVIQTRSFVTGQFTLSASRTLEVQHQCTTSQASNGFGVDAAFAGNNNVYTIVKIWQVKEG